MVSYHASTTSKRRIPVLRTKAHRNRVLADDRHNFATCTLLRRETALPAFKTFHLHSPLPQTLIHFETCVASLLPSVSRWLRRDLSWRGCLRRTCGAPYVSRHSLADAPDPVGPPSQASAFGACPQRETRERAPLLSQMRNAMARNIAPRIQAICWAATGSRPPSTEGCRLLQRWSRGEQMALTTNLCTLRMALRRRRDGF